MTVWLVISSNALVAETGDEGIARQLVRDLKLSGADAMLATKVDTFADE